MDNYFKECPPRLEDGHFITEYRNNTRINEYIKYLNGIERDDDYRMFLQKNGKDIMDKEWDFLKNTQSCWTNSIIHDYPSRMDPRKLNEELLRYNMRYSKGTVKPTFKDFRMTK